MAPLRIAYFGSDLFSVASLARLVKLHTSSPHLISGIDVFTKSIKPTGRKLQRMVDLPIGDFAGQHNLPIFRVDTSADILKHLRNYSLAVAVSYGRLIPGAFLESLPYKGLNVHPSMLPQMSGSSPIQYALMEDLKTTGVTVQTLHPTHFDRGSLIARSDPVNVEDCDNFSTLLSRLAEIGADLLAKIISEKLYVNPVELPARHSHSLAPKIRPTKSEINWSSMNARQIRRYYDALGPLYSFKHVDTIKKNKPVQGLYKVILSHITETNLTPPALHEKSPGHFALFDQKFYVKTIDTCITAETLKFQYCNEETPAQFMRQLDKRLGQTEHRFVST